jgi:hypothetical protein
MPSITGKPWKTYLKLCDPEATPRQKKISINAIKFMIQAAGGTFDSNRGKGSHAVAKIVSPLNLIDAHGTLRNAGYVDNLHYRFLEPDTAVSAGSQNRRYSLTFKNNKYMSPAQIEDILLAFQTMGYETDYSKLMEVNSN